MRRGKLVLAVVVGAAGITALLQADSQENDKPMGKAELGRPAPDFELKDVYGNAFRLSDFTKKKQVVVLEWINQDCPVSRRCHEQTIMQDAYRKYAGKDVVWLAVDTTHGVKPERNRVYSAERALAYPILHDVDGKVGRAYSAKTTPHMYVIDAKGVLVYRGALDDDPHGRKEFKERANYMVDALDAVLDGKSVARAQTDPYGCGVKYPPEKKD